MILRSLLCPIRSGYLSRGMELAPWSKLSAYKAPFVASLLTTMPTPLEALSNEHLQGPLCRSYPACPLSGATQRAPSTFSTSGGTHQDWPQRAVPLWQRQEVQTVLFALTNKIDSKRGPMALSCIKRQRSYRLLAIPPTAHLYVVRQSEAALHYLT